MKTRTYISIVFATALALGAISLFHCDRKTKYGNGFSEAGFGKIAIADDVSDVLEKIGDPLRVEIVEYNGTIWRDGKLVNDDLRIRKSTSIPNPDMGSLDFSLAGTYYVFHYSDSRGGCEYERVYLILKNGKLLSKDKEFVDS